VNCPFICSNIPAAPAYGVYISQMIRYSRSCGSYHDFLDRGLLLTRMLLNQGFLLVKLTSSLRQFYCRHHDLVDRYGISVSQMTTDMFHLMQTLTGPFLVHNLVIFNYGCIKCNLQYYNLVRFALPSVSRCKLHYQLLQPSVLQSPHAS